MARNQARLRINGGKTAAENDRLLPHLRRNDRALRGSEADRAVREDSVSHDEFASRHISTARTARGDGYVFIWSRGNSD